MTSNQNHLYTEYRNRFLNSDSSKLSFNTYLRLELSKLVVSNPTLWAELESVAIYAKDNLQSTSLYQSTL